MAEIKIEKKKPIWPWVLLVVIILLIVYFFWYRNDANLDRTDDVIVRDTISQVNEPYQDTNRMEETTLYTGTYGTVRNEEAFADYFRYVDNLDTRDSDRGFYRTAFFKLITAVKRQAEIDSVDVTNNISAAMNSAENLTNDPDTNTKADNAKKAADEISKALKTIQEKVNDNLSDNYKEVQTAASGIDGTKTLDTQTASIDAFFDKSARLLQNMNDNTDNR
ncbi:hypothetical protein EI546_00820 [Aequorivita sp. H23M31]|uniref:Uncharacterized protein n=1 Tax=Aequorivita ciconiae TaxID=2494375 RepID=A0A410FZD3_9FLAO|nr:hypothetical protein [Aequorivita sp. H23M31]QAA80361.1 hypothetical protein EI546_00820 [Aequorivita sp. H23M31]